MGVTFSKGEESKKRVLNAALELFIEQGYEKTTMRQIVQKSGVLNGSVYHAFRNKDALFERIIDLIFDRTFEKLNTENADVLTFFLLPAAMELNYASANPRFAELLYYANRSWDIFNGLVNRLMEYFRKYYEEVKTPFHEDYVRRYLLATVGMTAVFANEYHLTDNRVPVRTNLRYLLDYVCSVVHMPVLNPDEALDRVLALADVQEDFLKGLKFR